LVSSGDLKALEKAVNAAARGKSSSSSKSYDPLGVTSSIKRRSGSKPTDQKKLQRKTSSEPGDSHHRDSSGSRGHHISSRSHRRSRGVRPSSVPEHEVTTTTTATTTTASDGTDPLAETLERLVVVDDEEEEEKEREARRVARAMTF